MLKHPLQLKKSSLLSLTLESTENFDASDAGFTITTWPALRHSEDLGSWILAMRLQVAISEDGKIPPYTVGVAMAAEFGWHGSRSDFKETVKAVAVNGCSILYGQMRELILLLTSRGMNPPFQLPSLSFADVEPTLIDGALGKSDQVREGPAGRPETEASGQAEGSTKTPRKAGLRKQTPARRRGSKK